MFKKFRLWLPDIGTLPIVLLFILLFPFLLVVFLLFSDDHNKIFKEGYKEFLTEHEGEEFFCYTNRKNSEKVIEGFLPKIDKTIHIVKLEGKRPRTTLEEKYISHALYNIKKFGFPNIMKIVNGKVVDYSLHNEFYQAINQGKLTTLPSIFKRGLAKLRRSEK